MLLHANYNTILEVAERPRLMGIHTKHTFSYPTPVGTVIIEDTNGSVSLLQFSDTANNLSSPSSITNTCATQIMEFLAGKRRVFDVPYTLEGTDFQKSIWQAVSAIPYTQTRSASEIAALIGQPSAQRQVGKALAACPCPLLVPIHRVTCTDDELSVHLRALERTLA